jgi:hypothetical protein
LGARLAPTGHLRVAAWGPNQLASATLKKDFQHECCNKGHPLSILPRNASRSKKPEAYSINPVFGSKKHLINEWAISAFGPVRRSWRQTNREPRAPMATTNFTSAGPPAEDVPLNEQNGGFRPNPDIRHTSHRSRRVSFAKSPLHSDRRSILIEARVRADAGVVVIVPRMCSAHSRPRPRF